MKGQVIFTSSKCHAAGTQQASHDHILDQASFTDALARGGQEVEYVKQEAKLVYLLECLQKTAPPVLVFAEKTADVDDIHEYLLVKGVEAVAVHGGKDQQDREQAIDAFKVRRPVLRTQC